MVARQSGTLSVWKDDKGYGFIRPDDDGKDAFVHITTMRSWQRRPRLNDRLSYVVEEVEPNKLRAKEVRITGLQLTFIAKITFAALFLALAFLVLGVMGAMTVPWSVQVYILMSFVTFGAYRMDKLAADEGSWRISEALLHLFELAGGWPGALVAQQFFRHKNKKIGYQLAFWAIVVFHLGLWSWRYAGTDRL